MRSSLALVLLALVVGAGCDSEGSPAKAAEPAGEPTAEVHTPASAAAAAAPEVESAPPVDPAPSFDPLTVDAARVRIVEVHDTGWTACGRVHSVGLIEVEVLDAGEPAPRMALYVSCPADIGRERLAVGTILDVRLHAKRQSWPRPRVELPEDMPVRYLASIGEGG